MRRRVFKLFVFLLLGAVVNVAVAWGLVYARSPDLNSASLRRGGRFYGPECRYLVWVVHRYDEVGSTVVVSTWIGPTVGNIGADVPPDPPEPLLPSWAPELSPMNHKPIGGAWTHIVARSAGWPLHSMHGVIGQVDSGSQTILTISRNAARISQPPTGPIYSYVALHFIPAAPIWPGFAVNTAFYAVVCWLLVAAPFALLRRRRIKRGLCPYCKYPVGTSSVCTECARPVAVRPMSEAGIQ